MIDPNNPPMRVTKWTKELKKVLKRCPTGIWLWVSCSVIYIMACGKDGKPMYTEHGGVDPDYIITEITPSTVIDGGSW